MPPADAAPRAGSSWMDAAARIGAMLQRYLLLHRRSLVRMFDIFFWPVTDLLIWGFMTLYIQQTLEGTTAQLMVFLIGAMISWDIHYRGQQAVTIPLMEEVWTRNLTNLAISPLRLWEWVAATFIYGLLKVSLVTVVLAVLAKWLYAFELWRLGWTFLPLIGGLLLFGWAIGLFTAGLLLRFGYAAEALIWGIPFLVQPFSCVFYPMSALPAWAQPVARSLPSTYVFEGLRLVLRGEPVPAGHWALIYSLNAVAFTAAVTYFVWMFRRARATGRLARIARD